MSFRKIDIDAYDEDVLLESELYEPDPRDPAQALSDAKQKQVVVRSALAKYSHYLVTFHHDPNHPHRGDIPGALDIALDNAPYGPNVEEAKVRLLLGGIS